MVVVVVMMRMVAMLVMLVMLVVVTKACTGQPRHTATVMVMANNSQESQVPAMKESRLGLPDSVSLHVTLL